MLSLDNMSLNNKFLNLIPKMITEAQTSTLNMQLAATIIKGKIPISRICANTERSHCYGKCCGSLHAEAAALIDYYGRNLSWSDKDGWCFLPRKEWWKGEEKRYFRHSCQS
jgi:hypothetical protein